MLYSGTPGSGKSLHLAKVIYDALAKGITVICNFHIREDVKGYKNFVYIDTFSMSPANLKQFSKDYFAGKKIKEDEILLIIDECQMLFNPRKWQMQGRTDWLEFFTLHRHYGFYVLLVAQFDKMIDAQLRPLVEYECIHRKVSNFGLRGKVLSLVMGGSTFFAVRYWYPVKQYMSTEVFHGNKKLYSLYDTFGSF
jgi:zona occludens toxin (predicted ATPase)